MKQAASGPIGSDEVWPIDNRLSTQRALKHRGLQPHVHQSLSRGLASILWRNFTFEMTLSALLGAISIATAIAQPFLLRSVLETCTVLPVLGLFSASLIGGATEAHMKFLLGRIGIQLRAALTALLCNECMATGERGPLGSDPLVLIEVDSAKVFELVGEYHLIWMIPLQTGVSIAALAMILGWKSVAAGFLSPVRV
jgi:hypothetical protein